MQCTECLNCRQEWAEVRNESEQGKRQPSHKRSYSLDKGVYDDVESIGEIIKDKITGE